MPVTVQVTHRPGAGPGATVVRIGGTLEADTVAKAKAGIDPVVLAAPRVVVLDLGELKFLSSVGISLLLDTQKRLAEKGSKVFMTNMQPQIARVMEIVQVLPQTVVFKDISEMDAYLAEIQRKVTEGED